MAMFTAIGTSLGLTGMAATIGGAAVTAGIAGAGFAAASLFNKPKKTDMPKFDTPKAPEAPTQKDAAAAANKRLQDKKRAMARSKSVKTNPLGLKDEADVARKRLLGG